MNLDFSSFHALVCGASQGLGEAIARGLAEHGAKVTLVARNEERLHAVKASLGGAGHATFSADFYDPQDVERLCAYISESHVDVLVNNAGGPAPGPVIEAETSQFQAALQAHLHTSHQLMKAALPYMRSKGFGRFINIISTSVKVPIRGLGVSNTVRGAMASWAKTVSMEVGAYGITMNNILPGFTETERLTSLIRSVAARENKTEEEIAERMKSTCPAGRFGRPEEIADLAVFLASRSASYINGTSIPVDGGSTGSI